MFYRENRIVADNIDFKTKVEESTDNDELKLINISNYGAGFKILNDSVRNELYIGRKIYLNISLNKVDVYVGNCIIVNISDIGIGVKMLSRVDIDFINAMIDRSVEVTFKNYASLPMSYKSLVGELISLFSSIKQDLDNEESFSKEVACNENELNALMKNAVNRYIEGSTSRILEIQKNIETEARKLDEDKFEIARSFYQSLALPFLHSSPFLKRAYEKPLGYAGDYEMMLMLFRKGYEGATFFDKYCHKLVCMEPAGVANYTRTLLLKSILSDLYEKKKDMKISLIACGGCKELELFIEDAKPKKLTAFCIDQEVKALDSARSRIYPKVVKEKDVSIKFIHADVVLGFLRNRKELINAIADSDIIICSGLYDYLNQKVAKKLTEKLANGLKNGGDLYIGNISKDNPSNFIMDFGANWRLEERNENDLLDLAPSELEKSIVYEETKVNLFLKITK